MGKHTPPIRTWDESERLAALNSYAILDTPPEPDFDDLVLLIAQICEAPRAAINLIDHDRQWFKAEVGLGKRETPLDVSICGSIILQPGLTIIPDIRKDARFASNPLVTGSPHIRFYAGVLLETSEGVPLGTLCVLDDDVRQLNAVQTFALQTLARQVMALLELRRAVAQRDRALADHQRSEERGTLLTRELHHRVKNTLATVQAVASSTARSATSVDEFKTALSGRIGSLAKAHAVITEDEAQSAAVSDLLQMELSGFSEVRPGRISLSGPPVRLSSEIAIPLGLAIHELAANSAQHGALSTNVGQVTVMWRTRKEDGRESLVLDWLERGGPPVHPPTRYGFGSRVLERVLGGQIGAKVDVDYDPQGLEICVCIPLRASAPVS
jgi:two-component sensor histidine kinase